MQTTPKYGHSEPNTRPLLYSLVRRYSNPFQYWK